jgi:predicted PurR-regulated permease PerM
MTLSFVGRAVALAIALWALAQALWLARDFLFVVFLALLMAAFLSVFVDRLERLRVPRAVAAPLVLILFLATIVGLAAAAWPELKRQASELQQQGPKAIERVWNWFYEQYQSLLGRAGTRADAIEEQLGSTGEDLVGKLASGVVPVLTSVGGALSAMLIITFAAMYMSIDAARFHRVALLLVPQSRRDKAAHALERLGYSMRRWMVGTVFNMLVVGTASGVGLWLLGVPAPLALGLIAGLLEFIPVFGPILAAIPAIAIAVVISPGKAISVALLYLAIQQLESVVLSPLVMKGAVKIPPALSVLFQLFMALLFGFIGLLVAVPVLAAVVVLVKTLYLDQQAEEADGEARDPG